MFSLLCSVALLGNLWYVHRGSAICQHHIGNHLHSPGTMLVCHRDHAIITLLPFWHVAGTVLACHWHASGITPLLCWYTISTIRNVLPTGVSLCTLLVAPFGVTLHTSGGWVLHLPLHRLYNHRHCQLWNSPSKAPSRTIGVWCYMAHDVQSELFSRFLGWAMLYGEDTSTCYYPAGIYQPNVLHGILKGGLHFPSHVTHNTTPLWACLYCMVTPHHSWANMSNTVTLQSWAQVQLAV